MTNTADTTTIDPAHAYGVSCPCGYADSGDDRDAVLTRWYAHTPVNGPCDTRTADQLWNGSR